MKAEFIRERFYKGKTYKIGEIVDMSQNDFKIYQRFNAVKFYVPSVKSKPLEEMSFKDLQALCKKNNISAAGKKEDLVDRLNQLKENNVG